MTYTIYKATNKVNNKCYVGFCSNMSARKSAHKTAALTRNEDTKFYRAIRKYGWEAFEWSVLEKTADRLYALNVLEPKFITEHDSLVSGYNSTQGGEGTFGYKHTEHSKNKMKSVWTDERRQQLSAFRKSKYFSSPEGKERTRLAHVGVRVNRSKEHQDKLQLAHQKYVYVTPLGEFNSIREAAKTPHGCSAQTLRNRCLDLTTAPEGNKWSDLGYSARPLAD